MAISDDFGDMLVHTVTWRPFVSDDDFGQPTFGAPQPFDARVDFTRTNFVNAQGQVAEARGEAWFPPISGSSEVLARSEFSITTVSLGTEVVQTVDVSVIDDDTGAPYATRLIFG